MKKGRPTVVVIGAGLSGIVCAYELKKLGCEVHLLEASHRVGGRVATRRHSFSKGLYGELGAMRIPDNHDQVKHYLDEVGLKTAPFDQKNKLIYLSELNRVLSYDDFEKLVRSRDKSISKIFPGMDPSECGKTPDDLWSEALKPVDLIVNNAIAAGKSEGEILNIVATKFDSYSLRTYLEQVAGWSQACIRFYETCSAHVVLDNGFIDSWIDGFLSSQSGGQGKNMVQVVGGMEEFAWALLKNGTDPLERDTKFGFQVTRVNYTPDSAKPVIVHGETNRFPRAFKCDYVVFAIPTLAMKTIELNSAFSYGKQAAIREARYVDVIKILLQFRERWWEKRLQDFGQGISGGLITDLNIRYSVFPSINYDPREKRGVILASYIFEDDTKGLAHQSEYVHIKEALGSLSKMFGPVDVWGNFEVGCSQIWSKDHLAGGAFCYFAPNQRTKFFQDLIRPEWQGRAVFAGEHASTLHGWIEGALQAATRAWTFIDIHWAQSRTA